MKMSTTAVPIVKSLDEIYIEEVPEVYDQLSSKFQEVFDQPVDFFVRAPGRVNLIGEHIDYEGYSVLPMAISPEIVIAVSLAPGQDTIHIGNLDDKNYSIEKVEINPELEIGTKPIHWTNYFFCGYKGAWLLSGSDSDANIGPGIPLNVLVTGNIPPAAGLSSSSALVVASTIASIVAAHRWNDAYGTLSSTKIVSQALDAVEIAEICRVAEQFIGTMSGGMDQAISCLGRSRLIHFNPLRSETVQLPDNIAVVIAHSLTRAEKAVTAKTHYNKRVVECMLASKLIARSLELSDWKAMKTLEDLQIAYSKSQSREELVSLTEMEELAAEYLTKESYSTQDLLNEFQVVNLFQVFDDSITNSASIQDVLAPAQGYRLNQRARHVYAEAARVFAVQALCNEIGGSVATDEQLTELGNLLNASQTSCRDLYECSCSELDQLTTLCKELGAFGSRLTGAGWGGSTVSLIPENLKEKFIHELRNSAFYESVRGSPSEKNYAFACKPTSGASIYITPSPSS